MIGKLVRRMNESVSGFLATQREELCFPVSVSIEPDKNTGSLRRRDTGRLVAKENAPKLGGETKTLTEDRIEFVVPFIRIGESYLAGEGRLLNFELSLPNGNVQIQAIGQSYELTGKHTSVSSFLISAKIIYMSAADREMYKYYLTGNKSFRKTERAEFALNITQR